MGQVMPVDIRYALGMRNVSSRAIKVLCPYHDDTSPSMAVYADGTKCFACGATENRETFLSRMEHSGEGLPEADTSERRNTQHRSRTYNPGPSLRTQVEVYHQLLMDEDSPRHDKVKWFTDRGIFRHTIKKYRLGHTGTLFTLPVWYGDELKGIRFRLDEEFHEPEKMKAMKYFPPSGQPILLFRPRPHVGRAVIVEGELDALALSQYGFDAITTTGGSDTLHNYLTPERLRMDNIVVATDSDDAGNKSYDRLCEAWGKDLPRLYFPQFGMDVSEYLLSIDVPDKRVYIEERMEDECPK